jgi:hypothetical protein
VRQRRLLHETVLRARELAEVVEDDAIAGVLQTV